MNEHFLPGIAVLLSGASFFYSIVSGRSKAAGERVSAVEGRVDKAEDRLSRIETDLRHLPDRDDSHRIEMTLGVVQSEVRVLAERMKPIAAISERLQEFLLEQAGRP